MSYDARRAAPRGTGATKDPGTDAVAVGKHTQVELLGETGAPVGRTAAEARVDVQRAATPAAGPAPADQVHAAAALGTRGPGERLPHHDTIQRVFGRHDIGGIVAHTDADAARGAGAMGAEAFATGSHVAFAGAPDLHTAAHEAAHVVQQRGGVQLKGGVGTAGDAHEQHADAVADRVVAGEPAEALLDDYADAAAGGAAGGAVQRLVTQIVPQPTHPEVIAQVNVVGRPERTYGNSMGDHSTAFTVHVEGIRAKLQGQPLAEAIRALDQLVLDARALPGFAMTAQLPPEMRARVEHSWQALVEIRARPAVTHPDGAAASALALDLQDYINAYLEFREGVPLSTINVAAKSPALAGKGKGESAEPLARQAHGDTVAPGELLSTAVNLFDAKGAALVAAEPFHELLVEMAPGLDSDLGYQARLTLLIDQHIASIASSFPRVFAPGSGVTPAVLRTALELRAVPLILEAWNADLAVWRRHSAALEEQATKQLREAAISRVGEAKKLELAAAELKDEKNEYDHEIARLQQDITNLEQLLQITPGGAAAAAAHTGAGTHTAVGGGSSSTAASSGAASAEADDERKQPLATQIRLAAGQITEVLSAGRSPSPFPGTMGAHSTSWVVHLDRMRRALIGKTVPAAIVELGNMLLPEADQMAQRLGGLFPVTGDHASKLTTARSATVAAIQAAHSAAAQAQPGLLQVAINELLTYLNYIPGATLEAADTGGKTEGRYRAVLHGGESGTITDAGLLREAILGLLDIKAAETPAQRKALLDNHLTLIATTYPTSYHLAGPAALKRSLQSLERRDDGDGRKRGGSSKNRALTGDRARARSDGAAPDDSTATSATPPVPMEFDFTPFGASPDAPG
jgi:hypothetical protein